METGTYKGVGTRILAELFGTVATIELAPQIYERARTALADLPHVEVIAGDSRERLRSLAGEGRPAFYFLDGHWSGEFTAGEGNECPVLDELAAISPGHPDDCFVIDDARLFTAPPPPPHDPSQWPTLIELFDALRAARPGLHVTLLNDQVIAVPSRAKPVVDAYGQWQLPGEPSPWAKAADVVRRPGAAFRRVVRGAS